MTHAIVKTTEPKPDKQLAKRLATLGDEVKAHLDFAEGLEITTQEDVDDVGELLREVKVEIKTLEDERHKVVDPLNLVLKTVNGWFSPHVERLRGAERIFKKKIVDWQNNQALRQLEAREAASKAHAAGASFGEQQKLFAEANTLATARAPTGFSQRKRWVFVGVSNPDILPAEWWTPDLEALKDLAKKTPSEVKPDVPGAEFKLETIASVRT